MLLRPLLLVGLTALAGCDWGSPSPPPSHYAARVGYYNGGQIDWDLWGDFAALEECQGAAAARYNEYSLQQRAYTWSCLLKDAKGGYASSRP